MKAQYSRGVKPPELKDSRGVRVIMERMNNEDDVFLGQNNTFKTLITVRSRLSPALTGKGGGRIPPRGSRRRGIAANSIPSIPSPDARRI